MADNRFELPVRSFPGRYSNADPHDLPPGATQSQDNIHSRKLGQLDVRDGFQATSIARAASDDIIALTRFDRPERSFLVWQTSTGKIQAVDIANSTTVLTIGTGYSSYQPMCFAQDRRGVLYGVNGLQRGFRWDGITAAVESLGINAPTAAPTITTPTGGSLSDGEYNLAYRYLDDDTEFDEFGAGGSGYPSSFSTLATATAAANDKFTWAGLLASSDRGDRVELWRTTSGQSRVYYRLKFTGVSAGQTYIKTNGTVSTSTNNGIYTQFTVPANHGLVVGAVITMSGNSQGSYNTSHTVTAVTATTVTTSALYVTAGGSAAWVLTGYVNDTTDDDTVATYQSMPYSTSDGARDIATRFVPPPANMPYIAFLQDRMFMAGTVEYTEGTIATNGTTTITGTSTVFTPGMVGNRLYVGGAVYTIATYSSATSITVEREISGTASGLAFKVMPPYLNYNRILFSEADEPEAMPTYNEVLLQQNQEDNDKITGLAPNNSELIVGQARHLYGLRYFRQPDIDAQPALIANRGMLNNRCWARLEDQLFILDSYGVHIARGPDVSEFIGDIWRTESLGSTQTYFFAVANRRAGYVRFHLNLSETGLPKRWLELRPELKTWTTGTYATGVAAACTYNNRTYYGSINRRLLVETPGSYLDLVNAGLRGSPTSSTSTVITNSGASFTDSLLDAPVSIVSGTGKGQTRYITARSGTTLTVNTAFTTTPDTTSVYSVGAIPWSYQTGIMDEGGRCFDEQRATENGVEVVFQPNADSSGTLDIRRYIDHSTTPAVNAYLEKQALRDYISLERGSEDAVLDLYRTRYTEGEYGAESAGFARWRWGGRKDRHMTTNRWVSVELRGFMHGYQVTIYDLKYLTME